MSLSVGEIFDDYVDSLANLPSEIDQSLRELGRMDEVFQRHKEAYVKQKRPYLKMIRNNATMTNGTLTKSPTTPSPSSTVSTTQAWTQIDNDYKTALQKQDQKIDLARQMYDLVSRHIERIDSQMAQNNISLTGATDGLKQTQQQQAQQQKRNHYNSANRSSSTRGLSGNAVTEHPATNYLHSTLSPETTGDFRKSPQWDDWPNEGNRTKSLLHGTTGPRRRTHHSNRPNPAMNTGALVEQIIDPNEPKYCYCNQVSFGDMVACDGDNCEKEWFHYACVGLTETPPGKWFCKDCLMEENYQKKLKRYH
ncbi:hypothetical protein BC941DRAFT_365302 [Chlamydoabsidia padenii]|nr:hypothetical protein BC941DRAFT_365302 [Chlamydoabsidia padenii]